VQIGEGYWMGPKRIREAKAPGTLRSLALSGVS